MVFDDPRPAQTALLSIPLADGAGGDGAETITEAYVINRRDILAGAAAAGPAAAGALAMPTRALAAPNAPAVAPTHIVCQAGGNTTAQRADGTVLRSLPTSAVNNSIVIQAAIDDAASSPASNAHVPGGCVMIDRGRYNCNTGIIGRYGVMITGVPGSWYDNWNSAGTFGTMIAGTATLGSTPLLTFGVSGNGSRVPTNPHGQWVTNLVLDNTAAPSADVLRFVDTAFGTLQHLFIRGGNTAMRLSGTSGPFTGTYDTNISRVMTKGNARAILTDVISGSYTATDGIISDCRFMSALQVTMEIKYGGWQISNCHFTHGNATNHLYADGVDSMTITGCYFDSGTRAGVVLRSGGVSSIIGCLCINDVAFTDATGAYISVPWGKCNIIGNILRTTPGTTGLKGFVSTGDRTRGVVAFNSTRRRSSSSGWVASVVDATGAAVADRVDAGSWIGGNTSWVDP